MRRIAVLLAALALAVLTAAAVAQAQSGEGTTQAQPGEETTQQSSEATGAEDKAERHCVIAAVPAGSEEEASEAGPLDEPRTECFPTFRQAVERATAWRIKDAPNDASRAALDKAFHDRLFAPGPPPGQQDGGDVSTQAVDGNNTYGCCTVLSVEYEDADYRGNTATFAAGGPCIDNGAADYVTPNVGSKWNDEISSFTGSNRCDMRHFENDYYGGRCWPYGTAFGGCTVAVYASNMGYFNDLTTSIRWY